MDQLRDVLTQLAAGKKEAAPVEPEEEVSEVLTALTQKQRSASRQRLESIDPTTVPDADAMPQFHGRRLLQSNATGSGEFRVNINTTDYQNNPSIAVLTNGGFVVAWQGYGKQDGSGYGIYLRLYDANGTPQSNEIAVATGTSKADVCATSLSNGNFVVVWNSYDQIIASSWEIYARRYTLNGAALSGEFLVNTYYTAGQEVHPSIGVLSTGDFVIAWTSYGQDADGGGIYAQRYAMNGTALGAQFSVNTQTIGDQTRSSTTGLSNGEFIIVWASTSQDNSGQGVYAQRFATNGTKQDNEFKVNTYTINNQLSPRVNSISSDSFVVTWASDGQDSNGYGIYAQRFALNGTALGSEFRVNTYTTFNQTNPRVTALIDNEFMIAWSDDGRDGSGYGVYAQRYAVNGVPRGGQFLVNSYTLNDQSNPSLAALTSGDFVVVWRSNQNSSDDEVYARICPLYDEFQVNTNTANSQESPRIAGLSNGDFVITWSSYGQDGSDFGVYAQRYSASSVPIGSEFQVNTNTTSYQNEPCVAGLANGGFVIAWTSGGQDADQGGVYAQRYTANGTTQDGEFQVNTYTLTNQAYANVAGLTNSDFVVTWESGSGEDGSGYGVYARRYATNGTALNLPFLVNTNNVFNDQRSPHVAGLANGGFVITWASFGQDTSGWGIYANLYAANGTSLKTFQANTYVLNDQMNPRVLALTTGDFIIAWQSYAQQGGSWQLYAQRYGLNGTAIGFEFCLNKNVAYAQSAVSTAALNNGEFVIVGHGYGQDDNSNIGIYAQRFSAEGDFLGSRFSANTYTLGLQQTPRVAALTNNDFVIVWQSGGQDTDGGVYARLFSLPTFINNQLAAIEGAPTVLTTNALSARDSFNSNFIFTISGLQHGIFQHVINGSSLTQFTRQQIANGEVRFLHDGSEFPPAYNVSVSNRPLMTEPSAASVSFTNIEEFRVNSYTTAHQSFAKVAALANGGFVIVWQSGTGAAMFVDKTIYARRYDMNGAALESEFSVSTVTAGFVSNARVAALPNGGFVVVWDCEPVDGSSYGICAQIHAANATTVGNSFVVNDYTFDNQYASAVTVLVNGGFLVSWMGLGQQDTDQAGVYARRYTSNGTSLGASFLVNRDYTLGSQGDPAVGALRNGDFVIAWDSDPPGQGQTDWGVYARRYTINETFPEPETHMNSDTSDAQWGPSIAMLPNDDFVVTWKGYTQGGNGSDVYARRHFANGTASGLQFRVNAYVFGSQSLVAAAAAGLSTGNFVITWESAGQDGSGAGIYARQYTNDGTSLGTEFPVNTYTLNDQKAPSIAALSNGSFVVVWHSDSQDGDGYGVYTRLYFPPELLTNQLTKDYTAPPRDKRYYQPVSLADIQAYLATPEIKAARAAKKTAALSFHDYLHQQGRPAELQAVCHEDLTAIKDWSFANFKGVDFSGVKITGNLSGTNFSGSYLVAITADTIECHKNHPVNFAQSQLGFANLQAAKLPKADFTQVELQLTNLSHADLTDIQCLGANWYKTDLTGVTRRDLLAEQAMQVAKLQRQFQERMQQLDGRIAKLEQELVPKLTQLEALQKSSEKVAADKAEELAAQITKLQTEVSDIANNQFRQFCEAELQELREFKKALRDDMDRLNVKVQQHAAEQKAEMRDFKKVVSDDMAMRDQYILRRMDYLLQRQAHYKQHPEEDKSPIDPRYRIPLKELNFSPDDFIAGGSVSYVYKVQWQQQIVAVKVFEVSQSEEDTAEFVRETAIMGRLRNPNVVQFYGACLEENSACLVMEYMEQGSLFDHLAKAELTPGQQKQIAIDIAKGVHYLHHQGIVHRDLKSGNVLLNKEGHAKITDFGLSKIQTHSVMSISKKTEAIAWCAPEFLQEGQATPKTDMFSFGMVVWEIFTGKKPFADLSNSELTKKILAGEREVLPKDLPEGIAKLIQDCWSADPAQRPDAAQALQRLETYNPADVYYEKAKKLEEAREYKSAQQYYQSAADLGSFKAVANLGMFALKGVGGMPADKARAYDLLLQAAHKGNIRAMRNLAVMLDTGDGVKQDQARALEWYEKAGDEASLKRATRLREKLQLAPKPVQPTVQPSPTS